MSIEPIVSGMLEVGFERTVYARASPGIGELINVQHDRQQEGRGISVHANVEFLVAIDQDRKCLQIELGNGGEPRFDGAEYLTEDANGDRLHNIICELFPECPSLRVECECPLGRRMAKDVEAKSTGLTDGPVPSIAVGGEHAVARPVCANC